jgi:hypothetical protein
LVCAVPRNRRGANNLGPFSVAIERPVPGIIGAENVGGWHFSPWAAAGTSALFRKLTSSAGPSPSGCREDILGCRLVHQRRLSPLDFFWAFVLARDLAFAAGFLLPAFSFFLAISVSLPMMIPHGWRLAKSGAFRAASCVAGPVKAGLSARPCRFGGVAARFGAIPAFVYRPIR